VDISGRHSVFRGDSIDPGQNTTKRRAFVNTVMNAIVKKYGKFLDKLRNCVLRSTSCFFLTKHCKIVCYSKFYYLNSRHYFGMEPIANKAVLFT